MEFFESAYRGRPPWDIGRPQKEFVDLVCRGEIRGSVLDIGCGTGDNALFFAEQGHDVWGVDANALAIQKAQEKNAGLGLPVQYLVLDALDLVKLNRQFDTVTDSGLFHTLSDENRPVFTDNLADVLAPEGNYFMLCFSDQEPAGYGPRRITQEEIRDTFSDRWVVRYIRPAIFESNTRAGGSRAWLTSIARQ